jgi:hypothetical protein
LNPGRELGREGLSGGQAAAGRELADHVRLRPSVIMSSVVLISLDTARVGSAVTVTGVPQSETVTG